MSKIIFRYFYDFVDGQEKWLNSMADSGYRLKKCGRVFYVFEECQLCEYEYAVEFVGHKAYSQAKDYRRYLEGVGFRTFTKSINIKFSYGKVKWRPYAAGLGQITTSPGGFNKELLILEKKRDGKPFELHTDLADKLDVYRSIRRVYIWAVLLIFLLEVITFIPNTSSLSDIMLLIFRVILFIAGGILFIPLVKYSSLIRCLKDEGKIYE